MSNLFCLAGNCALWRHFDTNGIRSRIPARFSSVRGKLPVLSVAREKEKKVQSLHSRDVFTNAYWGIKASLADENVPPGFGPPEMT